MEKQKKDYKSLLLAYGKPTKIGSWSGDLTLEHFEVFQGLTKEQIVGGKLSTRTISSKNKKTGEEFTSVIFEILLPERVQELKGQSQSFSQQAKAEESDI